MAGVERVHRQGKHYHSQGELGCRARAACKVAEFPPTVEQQRVNIFRRPITPISCRIARMVGSGRGHF